MYIYSEFPLWIDNIVKTKEPVPVAFKAVLELVYIGVVDDVVEVEIKTKASELGWLYKSTLALFHCGGILYECQLSKLKEFAEEFLKAKVFVVDGEGKVIGKIKLEDTNRVVGYLPVDGVLKLSNPIP